MNRCVTAIVLAILVVTGPPLLAQWPGYQLPYVPRTADGQPDLEAPTPRTPDGRPDLTGIWQNFRKPGDAAVRSVNAAFFDDLPPTLINEFRDIGSGVTGGLPLQPWAAALKQQRMAENSKDNPDAHCLPLGIMQLHTHSQPRKVIHTKDEMVILYEANYGQRQIYTDGRTIPDNEPQPWWDGYSVGSWDGDTLVVTTKGFRDDGWLDVNGTPFGSGTTITERYRRVNYGRLEIDVTIEDSKAYARPFTVRVNWRLYPDGSLYEFICNENEKSSEHLIK